MKGKLINDTTGRVSLLSEISSIGRSPESTITLADPRVSRRHAVIRREADGFWFFDQGSCNGSFLNGRRVTTAQHLEAGDIVRVGRHIFTFEQDGSSSFRSELALTEATTMNLQPRDTVLLTSDIRGFTGISERLSPDQLAPIIGTWYRETEYILQHYSATIDKFIGDSVLAYWPAVSSKARLAAVDAARAMRTLCDQVQQEHGEVLENAGLQFWTGTALHIGPAATRVVRGGEFTLLGDAVTAAFRLEKLTRTLEEPVLVSGNFLEGWEEGRDLGRSLGQHVLEGVKEPIEVLAL